MWILGRHVHVKDPETQSTAQPSQAKCLNKDALNRDGRAARVLGLAAHDPVEVVVLVARVVVEADVPLAKSLGLVFGGRDSVVEVGEDDHVAGLVVE